METALCASFLCPIVPLLLSVGLAQEALLQRDLPALHKKPLFFRVLTSLANNT